MISLYLIYYIQVQLLQTKKISESMETCECWRTGYLNPSLQKLTASVGETKKWTFISKVFYKNPTQILYT